jgi:hypothetical protein
MKKTLLLFLFAILLLQNPINAQTDALPENKYKEGDLLSDFLNNPKSETKGTTFQIGYTGGQFLNAQFGLLTKENLIAPKYGLFVGLKKIYYPIIIDLDAFVSKYDNYTSANSYTVVHQGFNFSISTAILPIHLKISSIIMPYIGVGYQLSDLLETSNVSFFKITFPKSDAITSLVKTNQPIWKIGILFNLAPVLFSFEYKQSLMINGNEKALNQYSIGLGYRFGHNKNR